MAAHEGYIVEFLQMGRSVRVTAIDPVSLREVHMIGTSHVSQEHLADLAVRKLRYVLEKEGNEPS